MLEELNLKFFFLNPQIALMNNCEKEFTMIKLIKNIVFILIVIQNCSHPLQYFYDEIHKYGYIHYTTPLKNSGTGTLIGGKPSTMELIAHPETCFPSSIDSEKTNLRYIDDGNLPSRYENIMVNSESHAEFFKVMASASPSIKAGSKIKDVKQILLEMKGVKVEYIDSIKLLEFYQEKMPDICKEFLDHVGFIIQAIRVDELNFTFYNKQNGEFYLEAEKIKQFLDISIDVDWEIEKGTKLIIKTPKYIGYQLGSLRKKSKGFAFKRSTKTKDDKWVFEKISIYKNKKINREDGGKFSPDAHGFYKNINELIELEQK
ncbi:MAG: hypothetical protein CMP11_03930 [Zetaproteobacteria bacterium]|nr:hypothetical protein [Pseudobdellovibrionaceae bacterium]